MGGGEDDAGDDVPLSQRAQLQKNGEDASVSAANSVVPPSHLEILPIACSRTLDEMLGFNHRLFLRELVEYDDD